MLKTLFFYISQFFLSEPVDPRIASVKEFLQGQEPIVFSKGVFYPEYFFIVKPYEFVKRIDSIIFATEIFATYDDFILLNKTHSYMHFTKSYYRKDNVLINNDFKLFFVCDPYEYFRYGHDVEINDYTYELTFITDVACINRISDRSEL